MAKTFFFRPSHKRAAAMAGALVALLAAPIDAAPSRAGVDKANASGAQFDGLWTIEATTTSFFCPMRSKQLLAVLRGGVLTDFSGLPDAKAVGRVDARGAVTLQIHTLGHNARIQGKLMGDAGEGGWASDSSLCAAGHWRAQASR